ncbi:MAG TPA: GNAT family N-acetyltransferase [Dehalococcoidia bacterium]|nr:GNAT family N-acetyltransferase [Dehalococcoidia bacterium]
MTQDNPIPGRDAAVSLREVTYANLFEVLDLKVKPEQECLVGPNSVSISEAHFWPTGRFRAIYAVDTPVGFVMIDDHYLADENRTLELRKKGVDDYYLQRFMIDGEHRGKGYGFRAMELVIEHVKSRPNATQMTTNQVTGGSNAGEFYKKLGFEHTGEEDRCEPERLVF